MRSFTIVALKRVLQLLEDHHSLIVLRHAPADIDFLESWPVFDLIAIFTTNAAVNRVAPFA